MSVLIRIALIEITTCIMTYAIIPARVVHGCLLTIHTSLMTACTKNLDQVWAKSRVNWNIGKLGGTLVEVDS